MLRTINNFVIEKNKFAFLLINLKIILMKNERPRFEIVEALEFDL